MKSKIKELLNDTLIFAIGRFGSRLVLFFLVPIYTNFLSTEEYGTADLVFTVSQFIVPLISVVIDDALLRFGLSKIYKREDAFRASLSILFLDILVMVFLTPVFSLYTAINDWKYFLSVNVILTVLNSIQLNYLKVKGKNLLYSISCIIQALCVVGFNILFLVYMKLGVQGYLLATIYSFVISNLFAFVSGGLYKDIKDSKRNELLLREMLKYSFPLVFNNISWWVIQSSDKLLLERMINASALGLFTAASKIPSLIFVFVSIFQQAWGISAIKEIESTNDEKYYSSVFNIFSTFIFFVGIVLISITKIFMRYYVGPDYFEAWILVPMLLASAVFSAISAFYGSLYGALKKSINNMITTVTSAFINISANYFFILHFGLIGAVIGTLISYVYIAFVRMVDINRFIHITINKKIFFANTILIILQAILVSYNYHIYVISFLSIVIFLLINRYLILKQSFNRYY